MTGWRPRSLRDAGVVLIDCVHNTPAAQTSGFPYVGIPQMKDGRIDFSTARRISEPDFIEWTKKAKPQRHDVILSRRTNPGVTAVDDTGTDFALGQNLVLLRADGSQVEPAFLKWLTRSPEWWLQIQKFMNVGAVFDSLRCADVPKFELTIPPLAEQRGIAELLGALDDKIELNRRMNETLEAMARAIFRDWFVDYGPTRAKREGRQPYLVPEIWSLFPERLDAEGKPEGWDWSPLLDHARLISGGTPKTEKPEYWGGAISWASAKDVSQCRDAFLIDTERSITQLGVEESATRLVPALSTVVVARGATTGRYCMFGSEMAMNQTCYALASRTGHPYWLSRAFEALVPELIHAAHGSVFDTITTRTIQNANVMRASDGVVAAFENTVQPLFSRVLANIINSRTLAETRDVLLPKLMSGEIQLKTFDPIG